MPIFDPPRPSQADTGQNSKAKPIGLEKTKDIIISTDDCGLGRLETRSIDWSKPKVDTCDEQTTQLTWLSSFTQTVKWTLTLFACVCSSIVLLVIFSHAVSLLKNIASLPEWLQWFCYSVLGLLFSLSFLGVTRLVFVYTRFSASSTFRTGAIDELESRGSARVNHDSHEAKDKLKRFIQRYPADANQRKLLSSCIKNGSSEKKNAKISELYANIEFYGQSSLTSDIQWVENVNEHILDELDRLADNRIKSVSWSVGAKTAVSPSGPVDSLIALSGTWLLIGELCRIYGVRPNWFETSIIFTWVVFNTFISYRADEISDKAEKLAENIPKLIKPNQAESTISDATVPALKAAPKIASKISEGAINGILLSKLGNHVQRKLRPLPKRT